jgi:hypothetical protein
MFMTTKGRAAGQSVRPATGAGICFLGSPFLWLRLPETKGQTLQEIERALVD